MAKFIVTSGSTFDPFTYDDLVKPLEASQKAHDAAEEVYSTLDMETSALARYITDNPDDRNAKALYDNYLEKLHTLQEDLWNNGVTNKTKRELASARSAYASDILRLQASIKKRQEDSKAYWDTKHNHPDMIMGSDPASSGLDAYLADENYGNNYFTYSGDTFMQEVAADAKNRAKELRRTFTYDGKSVPGYITRLEREGFTSEEVAEASDFVDRALATGNRDMSGVSEPAKILAETLLSHLDSTGAANMVDKSEFNRLVEYGRAGLSSAIGGFKLTDLNDKVWDFQKQLALVGAKSKGTEKPEKTGYSFNQLIQNLSTAGFNDLSKSLKGQYENYGPDGVGVILNGQLSKVSNPWEMSAIVFNTDARQEARKVFGGLDVALPAENFFGTTDSKQIGYVVGTDGNPIKLVTGKMSKEEATSVGLDKGQDVGLYYANGKLHKEATKKFNDYRHQHEESVKAFQDANPDLKLDDYSITPGKERELRKQYSIPETVDSSDIPYIIMSKEHTGDYTPATLISTDSGDDYARENFGRAIISSFNGAANNGKVSKGSPYAFYPASKGGISKSGDGEVDIKKVFGDNPDPKTITDITFLPQDIAAGAGRGRSQFRFSTTATPGKVWYADTAMLGTQVDHVLKAPLYNSGPFAGWTVCDAVNYMMTPFMNPTAMAEMTDAESTAWAQVMYTLLHDMMGDEDMQGPMVYSGGQPQFATGKDIFYNSSLRDQLYSAVVSYINYALRAAVDTNQHDHPQNVGNTSIKPVSYR